MTALQISLDQAAIAAKAADEKLGENIGVIDVSNVIGITDIFVIVSADNERKVNAIVQEIEDDMTDAGFEPKRREGVRENRWVLLDYGNIVVHVQRSPERDFYGLDRLPAYERPGAFADGESVRSAQQIEDLPLAGDAPEDEDEF